MVWARKKNEDGLRCALMVMNNAPINSINKVPFKIKLINRTIPPTFGAEIAFCIVLRCMIDIFLPDNINTAVAVVITPRPPICIRNMITVCPKADQ